MNFEQRIFGIFAAFLAHPVALITKCIQILYRLWTVVQWEVFAGIVTVLALLAMHLFSS